MNINNFKISNRLMKCAEMIDSSSKIVDVGTDHAYLPIYLLLKHKISKAIAADININPLKSAKSNIKNFGLENLIETCLSNGLENINEDEVDEVVIAGMGGNLIINILENCNWKSKQNKKFILQPMKHEKILRVYLSQKGYKVEKEIALKCMNKIYVVIKAAFNDKPYVLPPFKEYIGNLDPKSHETELYINKQIQDLNNRKIGACAKKHKGEELYYSYLIKKLKNKINLKEEGI